MDNEIKIRDYRNEDYAKVLKLDKEFSKFFEDFGLWQKENQDNDAVAKYYLDKTLELVRNQDGEMYVAETENNLVGFAAAYIRQQTDEEALTAIPMKFGHLESLFVSESYRNQGVGELLIKKAEEYYKSKGCTHSELDVFGPNTKAHNFYVKNGYTNIKIGMIKEL